MKKEIYLSVRKIVNFLCLKFKKYSHNNPDTTNN